MQPKTPKLLDDVRDAAAFIRQVTDGKTLEVNVHVEDPGAFTTPWNAKQRFRRIDREWEEDICAENNTDFLHYEVVPPPHADWPDF